MGAQNLENKNLTRLKVQLMRALKGYDFSEGTCTSSRLFSGAVTHDSEVETESVITAVAYAGV